MNVKNRTADILYAQMLDTTAKAVGNTALGIMNAIQDERVCNQMLGLAAALICMLHQYELTHTDVLGIAHNIVYSDDNNNMLPDFKAIKRYMKTEWELR